MYGNCQDPTDCKKQCNGGNGTLQSGLGICQCDNAQNVDDICNAQCRAQQKKVTFNSDGSMAVYDPVTKTTTNVNA